MTTLKSLFLHLSLPLLLPLQHEYMLLYGLIMQTIPGFTFLGMGSTIHMFLCQYTVNCGGVLP
jgi:hypothetical protein